MIDDDSKSEVYSKVLKNFNVTMDLIDLQGEGFCGCGHAQLISELLLFACRALEVLSEVPDNMDRASDNATYAKEVFELLGDLNDTAEIVHEGYKEQGLNKS